MEEKYRLDDIFFVEHKGNVYKTMIESLEKDIFEAALDYSKGNKLKTARLLGINRNTLSYKLKKLGIRRS